MEKTIKALFTYAGHTMGVQFAQDQDGTYYVQTVSLTSRPIEDGTYPKFFAEGEAVNLITNEVMGSKTLDASDRASVEGEINSVIKKLIADGTFEAVN